VNDCPTYLTLSKTGVYIRVHAQPAARKEGLRGIHGDAIKLAVHAAPQDGKANVAIAVLLATLLCIAKSDVSIVAGHQSRSKRFFIEGNAEVLMKAIENILQQ